MLVTALSPVIGYDKASAIAHTATEADLTLPEVAIRSGAVSSEDFDRIVVPGALVGSGLAGA
jgi:fumarate hydratase class II